MEHSIIFAGFGGQGVILAGKILAQAGMNHGLEVTWLPSYGPEMRGGTANCTIVLSTEPVGSPIVDEPTALVALNGPSLDKFEPILVRGGVAIVNESLIDRKVERDDLVPHYLRMNRIARDAGNARAINMAALGALTKALDAVPIAAVKGAMREMLESGGKSKFVPVNEKALDAGYEAI